MQFAALEAHIIERLRQGLGPQLTYHTLWHTQDVMAAADRLAKAEGISEDDHTLLMTAALLHDTGFLTTYLDHEEASVRLAEATLPQFGYDSKSIQSVLELIRATRIPQTPTNHLCEILCDADLDYLGRDDYDPIADTLYQEFRQFGIVTSAEQWHQIQIRFLSSHHYFTKTALETREAGKQAVLARLKGE